MTANTKHFHLLHYLILIIMLLFAVGAVFIFSGNPGTQFNIIILASSGYFVWGIVHHRLEGDLHAKIVVEYLLISIFAIILLKGAIFR